MNGMGNQQRRFSWPTIFLAWFLLPTAHLAFSQHATQFERSTLKASGKHQTELTIAHQGRYRLRATSSQGTSLQIVDAMAGVIGSHGKPGEQDGQLDLLLEKGVYLVRTQGLAEAPGKVTLEIQGFQEGSATPEPLFANQLRTDSLADLQQKTFEIHLKKPQFLRLEILGKHLTDARIWYPDGWTTAALPTRSIYEPETGKPMTHVEFHHALPAGRFLLVCYGGPAPTWSVADNSQPLYLRWQNHHWGQEGIHDITMSPFGRESYLVDGSANYIELHRSKPATTRLSEKAFPNLGEPRFSGPFVSRNMTKKSKIPRISLSPNATKAKRWIIVEAAPGAKVSLRYFPRAYGPYLRSHQDSQYVGTLHGAKIMDSLGSTGMMYIRRSNQEPQFSHSQLLNIDPGSYWWRQLDLQSTQEAWVRVSKAGSFTFTELDGSSATAQYKLVPFQNRNRNRGASQKFREPKAIFDLAAGIYKLTVKPKRRGLLNFAMHSPDENPVIDLVKPPPPVSEIAWQHVRLPDKRGSQFEFFLSRHQQIPFTIIQRSWPLTLSQPLPLTLLPGESRSLSVFLDQPKRLTIESPLTLGQEYQETQQPIPESLPKGTHTLIITNPSDTPASGNLVAILSNETVGVAKSESRELIRVGDHIHFNLSREETRDFQVSLKEPGIYRFETTGRLATSLDLHSKTTPFLAREKTNGTAKNAIIQTYLKSGDYLLRVRAIEQTQGRLGLAVKRSPLMSGGTLILNETSKNTTPAGSGISYKLEVPNEAEYRIGTMGLGKSFALRLEDADGWPVYPTNKKGMASVELAPGTYTYVSLPTAVDSKRLSRFEKRSLPKKLTGKKPHLLGWNQSYDVLWRDGEPDTFRFQVSATATVKITLSPGMIGHLTPAMPPIYGGDKWEKSLSPGSYELKVKRPESDDRFPYQISLLTDDLIPGLSQSLDTFPKLIKVTLAQPGLADFHFFGPTDVRATLLPAPNGEPLAVVDDSPHDWNPHLSQQLQLGTYYLKVEAIGPHFGPVKVDLSLRPEKFMSAERLPFKATHKQGDQVLRIPFQLTKEGLVQFNQGKGGDVFLSLTDGTNVLATHKGNLQIPLRAQKAYELWAWSAEGKGSFSISGKRLSLKKTRLAADATQLKMGRNAYISMDAPHSFRLQSHQGLSFSSQWETPLLPLSSPLLNISHNEGWLAGKPQRLRLQPCILTASKPVNWIIQDATVTLQLDAPGPGLLTLSSADKFWRMALAGQQESQNPWLQMAFTPFGVQLAIGAKGSYPIRIWRQDANDIASAVNLNYQSFELHQASEDLGTIPPSSAQAFSLHEQAKGLLLSQNLTAVWWDQKKPMGMWYAANNAEPFNAHAHAHGGELLIFNPNPKAGFARILTDKAPLENLSWSSDVQPHWEKRWDQPGQLQIHIKHTEEDTVYLEGQGVHLRFFANNGSYWEGSPPAALPNHQGMLEVHHQQGWLSLWAAPPSQRVKYWLGNPEVKQTLTRDATSLSERTHSHRFQIDSAQFRKFRLNQPGLLALHQEGHPLLVNTGGGFQGPELTTFLQPGTYDLITRGFGFNSSPVLSWSQLSIENISQATQRFMAAHESHIFQFQISEKTKVGLGIKSEHGLIQGELLNAVGQKLAEGPLIIQELDPGTYFFAIHNGKSAAVYEPQIFGLDGSQAQIPEHLVRQYLQTQSP